MDAAGTEHVEIGCANCTLNCAGIGCVQETHRESKGTIKICVSVARQWFTAQPDDTNTEDDPSLVFLGREQTPVTEVASDILRFANLLYLPQYIDFESELKSFIDSFNISGEQMNNLKKQISYLCEQAASEIDRQKALHFEVAILIDIVATEYCKDELEFSKKEFNGSNCSVCSRGLLVEERADVVINPGCKHTFHKDCIRSLLEETDSCPLCDLNLGDLYFPPEFELSGRICTP